MGFPRMKELEAKWIEQMVEYIGDNPQFIIRIFVRSQISLALDGISVEKDLEGDTSDDDYEEEDDDEGNDKEDTGNEEETDDIEETGDEKETGDEEQTSDYEEKIDNEDTYD